VVVMAVSQRRRHSSLPSVWIVLRMRCLEMTTTVTKKKKKLPTMKKVAALVGVEVE